MTSFNPDHREIGGSSRPWNTKQNTHDNVQQNYLNACSFTLSSKESLDNLLYSNRKTEKSTKRKSADSNYLKDISHLYLYQRKLGKGTYGQVVLASCIKTSEKTAIKIIKKSKLSSLADRNRVQREIDIGEALDHPNIIKLIKVFHLNKRIYMAQEYAPHGELYDLLIENGALKEQTSKDIFSQITRAVQYCHSKGIVHRDLKLENILVTQVTPYYVVKLADFGLANKFKKKVQRDCNDDELLNTFCGSLLYASPEVVQGKPYYGPKVDSWALGVILYALIYGAMPFEHTVQVVFLNFLTT